MIAHGDTIVVAHKNPEFIEALKGVRDEQVVVDLVRVPYDGDAEYDGICW